MRLIDMRDVSACGDVGVGAGVFKIMTQQPYPHLFDRGECVQMKFDRTRGYVLERSKYKGWLFVRFGINKVGVHEDELMRCGK